MTRFLRLSSSSSASSDRTIMTTYLAVLLFLLCTCSYFVQAQNIERFVISTTASFKQDATAGGHENCTYCDCTASTCKWVNNFTCTNPASYAAYGADDAQQRWGNCASGNCFCFPSSGIGFQGVNNVVIYSNVNSTNITRIGRVTHYNNAIYSGDSPTRLRLTLTVKSPQLQQPFVIAYPLKFIETLNTGDVLTCDPSIQRTNVSCDDRFSFEKLYISSSFVYNNIQYTLEAVGFLNANDLNTPLKQFVTREGSATRADIYARIVTYCVDTECKSNEIFQTSPCGCVCGLTDEICNAALTEDWGFDNNTCNCVCKKNETTACGTNGVLNTDTCGCDCNITDAYCAALNPLYGASLSPACGCDCKRQKYLDCYAQNPFYVPSKDKLCACVCQVSDGACEQTYGSGYTADYTACACIPPGGDGLSGGDIAGIVIGSLAGAAILFVLVLALGALLVWLIRSGKIPGIYGYKIDVADLNAAQQSPFYKDVWAGNTNAMAE